MTDLRQRWADGTPTHGLWSLLPGPVTAELLARTGADYVVVDLQHGAASEADLPGMAAAIRPAGAVPLVRTRSPLFAASRQSIARSSPERPRKVLPDPLAA